MLQCQDICFYVSPSFLPRYVLHSPVSEHFVQGGKKSLSMAVVAEFYNLDLEFNVKNFFFASYFTHYKEILIKKLSCHFSNKLLDCDLWFLGKVLLEQNTMPGKNCLTLKFKIEINFAAGSLHDIS